MTILHTLDHRSGELYHTLILTHHTLLLLFLSFHTISFFSFFSYSLTLISYSHTIIFYSFPFPYSSTLYPYFHLIYYVLISTHHVLCHIISFILLTLFIYYSCTHLILYLIDSHSLTLSSSHFITFFQSIYTSYHTLFSSLLILYFFLHVPSHLSSFYLISILTFPFYSHLYLNVL